VFGKTEDLVVLLVIVLVLFSAKKLPQLSKGIAESVREVRKGFRDDPTPPVSSNDRRLNRESSNPTAEGLSPPLESSAPHGARGSRLRAWLYDRLSTSSSSNR
jgi:TatA/E family protein of Tat protein translocase